MSSSLSNMTINGIPLYIPVERISVKQTFKNRENAPLRSSSSFTTSGFGSSIIIDLSIISNTDITNSTDFIRLFYSIKNFPYAFIKSQYIIDTIVGAVNRDIEDEVYAASVQKYINDFNKSNRYTVCVVHHMSVSTIPGTVDGMRMNLSMEYTVLAPFVPKLFFRKHYDNKSFMDSVYKEASIWWKNNKDNALQEGRTEASVLREFYDTRADNITSRIEDSEVYRRMYMPDISKLPSLSSTFNSGLEFIVTDKYKNGKMIKTSLDSGAISFMVFSINFTFPSLLLQGYPFPSHQYLGVTSSSIRIGIVAKQGDINNNETIKIANFYNSLQAADPDRQSKVKSGVIKTIMPRISVTNSFLNTFGVKDVVFKHLGKETLQGTSDGENLVISLIDTNRARISTAPRSDIKGKKAGDIFKNIIGHALINRGYAKQLANQDIVIDASYNSVLGRNDNFVFNGAVAINLVANVQKDEVIINETIIKSIKATDLIYDTILIKQIGERTSLFDLCLQAAEARIRATDTSDLAVFLKSVSEIVREVGTLETRGRAASNNYYRGNTYAISIARGRYEDFSRKMISVLLAVAYMKYGIEAMSSVQKGFITGGIYIATDGVVRGQTSNVFAEDATTDFKFQYDPFPKTILNAFDDLANISAGFLADVLKIDYLSESVLNLSNEIDNYYNGVGYPDFGGLPDHPLLKYLDDTKKKKFSEAVKKRINPDFFMLNGPQLANNMTKTGRKTKQPTLMDDNAFIRTANIFIDAYSELYDTESEGVFDKLNKSVNYKLKYTDGGIEAVELSDQGNEDGTVPTIGSKTATSTSKSVVKMDSLSDKLQKYDSARVEKLADKFPSGYEEKKLSERLEEYKNLPDEISPTSDEATRVLKRNVEFNYLKDNPGMIKAMPTFKIYFMDKHSTNSADWHILEDFYDMNGLIELRYVEEKNSPVQTVFMTIVSPSHTFMVPIEQSGVYYSDKRRAHINKKQTANPAEAANALQDMFPLKEGVDVQIRLGYDDNPHNMTTLLNGFVSSISGGELLNITITSYGAELIVDKRVEDRILESIDDDIILGVSRIVLNQEHVRHFGRWQLDKIGQSSFKVELQKLFGDSFLKASGFLGGSILDRNRVSRSVAERVLTATGWASSNYDENVYSFVDNNLEHPDEIKGKNYSSWDFIKELELIFPGYCTYALPYEDRMTLFIGSSQNVYAYRDYNAAELLTLKGNVAKRKSPYEITGLSGVINRILSKDKINIERALNYSSLPTGLIGDKAETVDDVRVWISKQVSDVWKSPDLTDTIYAMMFVPESVSNTVLNPLAILDNLFGGPGILTSRYILKHESIIPFVGDFSASIDIGEWVNTNRIDYAAYVGGNKTTKVPEAITRSVTDKFMHIYNAVGPVSDRVNFTVSLMLLMNKIDDIALTGAADATAHNYEWLKAISSIFASQDDNVSDDFLLKQDSIGRAMEIGRFIGPGFDRFMNGAESGDVATRQIGSVGDDIINVRTLLGDTDVNIGNAYWQDVWVNLNILILKAFSDSQIGKSTNDSKAIRLLKEVYRTWSHYFKVSERLSIRTAVKEVGKKMTRQSSVGSTILSYVPLAFDVPSDVARYIQAYTVLSSKIDPNSSYITKFVDMTGSARNRYRRFKQYHLASSITNILYNDVVLKENNVFNAVKIAEATDKGGLLNAGKDFAERNSIFRDGTATTDSLTLKFDSTLPQWKTHIYPYINPNADTEDLKKRYASKILADKLSMAYDGKIILLLNPEIRAKDSIFIQDTYRKMVGVIDIRRVVHVFSRSGCYTEIKPAMRVECYDIIEPSFLVVLGTHMLDMTSSYNSNEQTVQVVIPNKLRSKQIKSDIDPDSLQLTGQDLAETAFDSITSGVGILGLTTAAISAAVGIGLGLTPMAAASALVVGVSFINLIYGRDEYKVPIALRPVLQDNKPYIGSLVQKGPMNYLGYMAEHWTHVVAGTDIIIRKLNDLKNIGEPRIYRKWVFDKLK